MGATQVDRVLVSSRLVGDDSVTAFCRFVQDARRLSLQQRVRGALLFDGESAVHLIEGEPAALRDFMLTLYGQARYGAAAVVAQDRGVSPALPSGWRAGYVDPLALDAWSESAHGAADIAAFVALLDASDCE